MELLLCKQSAWGIQQLSTFWYPMPEKKKKNDAMECVDIFLIFSDVGIKRGYVAMKTILELEYLVIHFNLIKK